MALSAVYDYAASQNGNHETIVLPDGTAPMLPTRQVEAGGAITHPVASASPPNQGPPPERGRAGTSLNDLVARFRAESNGLAKSTRDTMDYHFKVAARHLDFGRDVRAIRLADLRALKSKLAENHKPASVNDIVFKGLGVLFKIAVEDEVMDKSPLEKLKRSKVGDPNREQPSWEQSQQIVDAVIRSLPETGIIVGFMRNFGVGQAEIKRLDGEHVDVSAGVIHFRRKKTGKTFDVPIFGYAKQFIEQLRAEKRLEIGKPVVAWRNPRKALESACEDLGLPSYSPRALRRTFIVHCLESGVDPRVVAEWQAHRDATLIFKVYGRFISKEHSLKMAEKLR